MMARRILILCKGAVGSTMSAPGIRAWNMARVLSQAVPSARITLAAPDITGAARDLPFRVVRSRAAMLPRLALEADVIIAQAFPPTLIPAFFGRHFVLDFFTYATVEGLGMRADRVPRATRRAWLTGQRAYLNLQFTLADFVLCANERQWDAWLGMMSSLGLLSDDVYDRDHSLRRLIAVAPFGIRPEPAAPSADGAPPIIKGVFPGVGADDRSLLWNGGILNWYDPLTLIRAVARLAPTRPDLRLVFLGTMYPWAEFEPGAVLSDTQALARELGLLNRHVFFNEGRLPYDRSGQAMLEADVGVSTVARTCARYVRNSAGSRHCAPWSTSVARQTQLLGRSGSAPPPSPLIPRSTSVPVFGSGRPYRGVTHRVRHPAHDARTQE